MSINQLYITFLFILDRVMIIDCFSIKKNINNVMTGNNRHLQILYLGNALLFVSLLYYFFSSDQGRDSSEPAADLWPQVQIIKEQYSSHHELLVEVLRSVLAQDDAGQIRLTHRHQLSTVLVHEGLHTHKWKRAALTWQRRMDAMTINSCFFTVRVNNLPAGWDKPV